MLSRLECLKTISQLSFDCSSFFGTLVIKYCYVTTGDIVSIVTRKNPSWFITKYPGRITSGGPKWFCIGPPMAISSLWCSLMSISLLYTQMMKVKDVGEIIDRVWIQTQCDFGYVETFFLWFGDASAFLRWHFGSGRWKCQLVFLHWPRGWKFAGVSRANV